MRLKTARLCLSLILVLALVCISSLSASPSVQAAAVTTTFYPTEINSVLNNPYMGWAPWASGGPYSQPHRLVYINATWRDLEPTKGNYAFDALETKNKFTYWASKGVKIIMRINMDYPGSTSHKDIPDWLYNEINGDGTWYDIDWGKGFSPNYNNTKLISYHRTLIAALAARYNNDKRVAIIALGSVGHWGEFHTKKTSTFTIPFPKESVTNQYVQPYIDYFTNKQLIMRRPFAIAKNNGMGLFNDSFGSYSQTYTWFLDYINNGYQDFLTDEYHPAMPDYWKTAPSGGEFANYPGLTYLQDSTIATTLQMVKDSHTSWLGPCSPGLQPSGTSLQANFDQMLKTMGYRFVIQSVTTSSEVIAGNSLPVNIVLNSKGVAPFYYKWPFELSLADSSGNIVAKVNTAEDIRTWLPGSKNVSQSLYIPPTLAAGTYTLCAAIIDPETNSPGIDLAIAGKRADSRYSLGQIKVNGAPKASSITISGSGNITIPASGTNSSSYSATVIDQYSATMPSETVSWKLSQAYSGVSVDNSGIVTVTAGTLPGTFTLSAVSNSDSTVIASKVLNPIYEPSVVTNNEILGSNTIVIPATDTSYSNYTISSYDQYCRAMSNDSVTWSLASPVTGVSVDSISGKVTVDTSAKPGYVTIKTVSNINPNIIDYKLLTIIYADPIVTSVKINGSTYIKIPIGTGVTYSDYTANVLDQYLRTMSSETVVWSLGSSVTGVTLNTGKIVVYSTAKPCTITLKSASNSTPGVYSTKSLILIN